MSKQPVFDVYNYDLIVLAVVGPIMLSFFLPWWIALTLGLLMCGILRSFYKSERKRLDSQTVLLKAEIIDRNGDVVGHTTYSER